MESANDNIMTHDAENEEAKETNPKNFMDKNDVNIDVNNDIEKDKSLEKETICNYEDVNIHINKDNQKEKSIENETMSNDDNVNKDIEKEKSIENERISSIDDVNKDIEKEKSIANETKDYEDVDKDIEKDKGLENEIMNVDAVDKDVGRDKSIENDTINNDDYVNIDIEKDKSIENEIMDTDTDVEKDKNLENKIMNKDEDVIMDVEKHIEKDKSLENETINNDEDVNNKDVNKDKNLENEIMNSDDVNNKVDKDIEKEKSLENETIADNIIEVIDSFEKCSTSENVTETNPDADASINPIECSTNNENSNDVLETEIVISNECANIDENLSTLDKETYNLDDAYEKLDENVDASEDPIAYDIEDNDEVVDVDMFSKEDSNECILPDTDKDCTVIGEVLQINSESLTFVVTYPSTEEINMCMMCKDIKLTKYCVSSRETVTYLCSEKCLNLLEAANPTNVITSDLRVKSLIAEKDMTTIPDFQRKCSECNNIIVNMDDVLAWETMDFCTKSCLAAYQKKIGSTCARCDKAVLSNLMGKYCVRFGCILRQFCSSLCLEAYKKLLKVCGYCQEDMSVTKTDVIKKRINGYTRDFCSVDCCDRYCILSEKPPVLEGDCSVCHELKTIEIEYEHENKSSKFCSEPCFLAFKFVNNIVTGPCNMCHKQFIKQILITYAMIYDSKLCYFCSKTCQNIYTIVYRKIIPCSWCKVKKYNFDMIQKKAVTGELLTLCSLNCLSLLHVSVNAVNSKMVNCDNCSIITKSLYHLTMSDASIRNFCSYNCVMLFQAQFSNAPIVLTEPLLVAKQAPVRPKTYGNKKKKNTPEVPTPPPPTMPIITSVVSLAPEAANDNYSPTIDVPSEDTTIKKFIIVREAPAEPQTNMATMAKPITMDKECENYPDCIDKDCQTAFKPNLIPIPVPIYLPAPIFTFRAPFPIPVPFPLPVQVPLFIPVTKNMSHNVLKELKKVQVKAPTDPFEAELLMMAELVASNNKKEEPVVETEEEAPPEEPPVYSPEPMDTNNTFGDDMLQMALKMATDFEEPAVDLEGALTANTITATPGTEGSRTDGNNANDAAAIPPLTERTLRGRKKNTRPTKTTAPTRRGRRSYNQSEIPEPANNPPAPPEPVEKPDANMCLKYTFGVNAWKQWVTTKNAELEKCSRRAKLFKTEILQLTSDELNYSLCLFVKEVRKPNGAEYAPDTIYYLCLGIQQYLYENGRIDNIFCDAYYDKFTDCLDEVCKKFSVLYNESHYIVTRVEEEHLWESKQLGAHSPHVLLTTLMFFNTKHFNLTTVDEHMQLSFSHIMKHWKRSPAQPGAPKSTVCRNVLLRFYPPQTASEANTKKRKVYEQQENEDNPLRCPVKLYEFYLSKCPESVKTRNDVFYLLPERSCVPDSPVWYSTSALGRNALEKMLHRVKMVKEVNVAVLTS